MTDAVIHWLNDRTAGLVFLLWGSHAQKKGSFINKVCSTTSFVSRLLYTRLGMRLLLYLPQATYVTFLPLVTHAHTRKSTVF